MNIAYIVPEDLVGYLSVIPVEILQEMLTNCIRSTISTRGYIEATEVKATLVPDMSELIETLSSLINSREIAITEEAPKIVRIPKVVLPETVYESDNNAYFENDDELDFLASICR